MPHHSRRILNFSEKFLTLEYLEQVKDLRVDNEIIVLNAGNSDISIEGKALAPWTSSIYSAVKIPQAEKLFLITLHTKFLKLSGFEYAWQIMQTWTHVYDILPLPHLKETKLWRSNKERIGRKEYNLWFAVAGTNCGIHNEHAFRELHTQIFGIGRMQKFHERDILTKYQDVFMGPGHTHKPFYDAKGTYPWHQYLADTDCIWLATEFYD